MVSVRRQGARPPVAPLVASALCAAVALSGCSASSDGRRGVSSPRPIASPTVSATSAAPTANPAAQKAIARAMRSTRSLQSYRFVVDEQLVAANTQRSRVAGAVVRGQGLTYRLTVGHKTTQVVRLRTATYVRVVPHAWSRLRRPRHLVNPTQSLIQILAALTPTGVGHSHAFTAVHGSLSVAAARHAGLPASKPADVTVTVDASGHVVALDVVAMTQSAGHKVTLRLRSTYDAFDAVPRIRRPV